MERLADSGRRRAELGLLPLVLLPEPPDTSIACTCHSHSTAEHTD